MSERLVERHQDSAVLAEGISFAEFLVQYEGQPVEWHAGKVVAKMSNNEIHQAVMDFLHLVLGLYLRFTKKGRIYHDGYQMRISDAVPARQPDFLIVLEQHYDRIQPQYLDGPADLVIEIISLRTGAVDRGDKYYEYQNAGVPEYWIIDPQSQQVDVFHLDAQGHYQRATDTPEKIVSRVLGGFVLDASLLWHNDEPDGAEIVALVQGMVNELD